jgi:hypothetical protein
MSSSPEMSEFSTGMPNNLGASTVQPGRDLGGGVYQRADGTYAAGPSQSQGVNTDVDFDWDSYLKDIDELSRMTQETTDLMTKGQGGPGVVTGQSFDEIIASQKGDTWRNGSPGDRRGAAGGGRTGGTFYQGPVYDYPELNLPGPFEYGATLDLPDYKPPTYNEQEEKAIREEFIQTGKGALSEEAQRAILGSANVNNPQARGQIIRAALEGFGDALGGIALKGSQEGRRGAEAKYSRDAQVYNTQFEVASKEAMAAYDQEMREDLMNWELEVMGAEMDYKQQLANWNSLPADVQAQQQGQNTGGVTVRRL